MVAKTFNNLSKKAKKNALYNYRSWTENPNATEKEAEEYYNMADGYGGALYLDKNGEILEPELYPNLY